MVIKGQVADVPGHLDDQNPRICGAGHHGPQHRRGEPVEGAGHVHEQENAGERDRYRGDLPADDPSQVPVPGLCGRLPETREVTAVMIAHSSVPTTSRPTPTPT